MSVYKKVRKNWLKQLTKKQKKQFKNYVQDISDSMLEAYEETVRLEKHKIAYYKNQTSYLPIDETKLEIRITIQVLPRYSVNIRNAV